MKKFYLDFELTAYHFMQERQREHKGICFEKPELAVFVESFCTYLNKKGYEVSTKMGESIKGPNDYLAVANKICDLLTETKCYLNPFADKKGLDALTFSHFFNENTFEKICKAFRNIDKEYFNTIVEYEADKTKEQYKNAASYKFSEEMYKLCLKEERKEEQEEIAEEEEENFALA